MEFSVKIRTMLENVLKIRKANTFEEALETLKSMREEYKSLTGEGLPEGWIQFTNFPYSTFFEAKRGKCV